MFKVVTRNGEKNLNFNQTSQNNLVDLFGDESETWKEKQVRVHMIRALVSGKMQQIVYLSGVEYSLEIDDNGNVKFVKENAVEAQNEAPTAPQPSEYPTEPNPDDVPF